MARLRAALTPAGRRSPGCLKEDLGAGGTMSRVRHSLGLVVTEAILAGDEDHCARRDVRQVYRIVSGARDDFRVRYSPRRGPRARPRCRWDET